MCSLLILEPSVILNARAQCKAAMHEPRVLWAYTGNTSTAVRSMAALNRGSCMAETSRMSNSCLKPSS